MSKSESEFTTTSMRRSTRRLIKAIQAHEQRSLFHEAMHVIVLEACEKRGIDVDAVLAETDAPAKASA
jgi:hypothetical protein